MGLFAHSWNKVVCIVVALLCSLPLAGQSKLLNGGTFTIEAPASAGWKAEAGDGKGRYAFRNQKAGDTLLILAEPFGQISDVKQTLNARADKFKASLESGGAKVLSFTKVEKQIDGAQCVSTEAAVDTKLAARKVVSLHLLECFTPTKTLLIAQYTYPAPKQSDPRKQEIDQLFSSLKFKK